MNSQSLARGLAFFSFGLGITQLVAPRQLSRVIGVDDDDPTLMRLLGLREVGAGLGILQGNSATFLWARVAGDAMDLGLLSAALRRNPRNRNRLVGAMVAVAGVTVLDIAAGLLTSRNPAEPAWRVARGDRGGLTRSDPLELRRRADETMAAHASGHLKNPAGQNFEPVPLNAPRHQDLLAREDAATRQFGPGD